jgi:hypothetical protein
MERIINANHFGIFGELRRLAEESATRRTLIYDTPDDSVPYGWRAVERSPNYRRREGDGTYPGLVFDGPQSPEIEAVLADHCGDVIGIEQDFALSIEEGGYAIWTLSQ